MTPVLTFFNNKAGVGKTSLVYHLAHSLADEGKKILVMDLDPQSNLTSAFLDEEELENIWSGASDTAPTSIFQCIKPLTQVGDILPPRPKIISPNLRLIPGDLALTNLEEFLAPEWGNAMGSGQLYRPFRILTMFWQVAQMAASEFAADLILVDVGPQLGSINRSVLLSSDAVVIPLAADLYSVQGLRNLGPTLRKWRAEWQIRVNNWQVPAFELPGGAMRPLGYVVQQQMERADRPLNAYAKWAERISEVYHENVTDWSPHTEPFNVDNDPNCLATVRHYRSLVPMSMEARKPMFHLTPSDGAIASHATAVRDARAAFQKLGSEIGSRLGL